MLKRCVNKTAPLAHALNIKVGKVVSCELHPQADRLYVSQIDVGHDETVGPIQVVSGLVDYVPQSQMVDKRVVVLTNMRRAKIRGVRSGAMVLATNDEARTKVELINPPTDSEIGDSLCFGKFDPDASANTTTISTKLWKEIQQCLFVNEEGIAVFRKDQEEYELKGEQSDVARADTLRNTEMS